MPVYLDVLMVLNFMVDFLLLLGTNRLSGYPCGVKRTAIAAALGGVYGGICVVPGWTFLAGTFWRLVSLVFMAGIGFGFRREAARRCILFVLLSMALGGVAVGLQRDGALSLIMAAGMVCALCVLGFRGKLGQQFVPVQIGNCGFTALVDTGNTLTDPLTGQQVLVVSATIGRKLLNVGMEQLVDPIGMMNTVPGTRLIPFHAVGKGEGLLPVKRFDKVRIGSWQGSCLVAFAPNELGQGKAYEALTGGVL